MGSMRSRYLYTIFHYGNDIYSSSYIHQDSTNVQSASMFYGIVASPPPVGNFLVPPYTLLSEPTILPSSLILGGGLPVTQLQTGVWRWWITVSFSSTMILVTPLPYVLFGVYGIYSGKVTGNETIINYDDMDAYLYICGKSSPYWIVIQ